MRLASELSPEPADKAYFSYFRKKLYCYPYEFCFLAKKLRNNSAGLATQNYLYGIGLG